MSSKPDLLDQVFKAVEKGVSTENGCSLLIAMDALLSSTKVKETVGLAALKAENYAVLDLWWWWWCKE